MTSKQLEHQDAGTALQPATAMRLPSAAASEAAALISLIERAAADPNIDIDRVERMYQMYERASARNAKAAYLAALAEMQPKLPVIEKRGKIERGKHKTTGADQKSTAYAHYEDVIEGINPHLHAHGFSLSFRITQPDAGRVMVTGVLGHREGHSEETSFALPIDDSGGKNNVQGWGSSVSYGKRYTAFALLNIVARNEDDDGKRGGDTSGGLISPDQAEELSVLISETKTDIVKFLAVGNLESLSDMPSSSFEAAKRMLLAKRSKIQGGSR